MAVKIAVIYYSSTGHIFRLAEAAVEGVKEAGAEVRLRRVRELAPREVIESQPAWKRHLEKTAHIPVAELDDLAWADGYLFGTPTRFGGVAAQLKQFLDTAGPLWLEGKLANKVVAGFTSAQNPHGGQEQTLINLYTTFYHWGCLIVPPGYTDATVFAAGGNPYGVSVTAAEPNETLSDSALAAARYLGRRVATVATWIEAGRMARV